MFVYFNESATALADYVWFSTVSGKCITTFRVSAMETPLAFRYFHAYIYLRILEIATASSSEKIGTAFDLCMVPMPIILVPVYCGIPLVLTAPL